MTPNQYATMSPAPEQPTDRDLMNYAAESFAFLIAPGYRIRGQQTTAGALAYEIRQAYSTTNPRTRAVVEALERWPDTEIHWN